MTTPQAVRVVGAGDTAGGAIDTVWSAGNLPERQALKDRDGILQPDHIAEACWPAQRQPRSTWTHEMDRRPCIGPF